jgi:hypothetical protein
VSGGLFPRTQKTGNWWRDHSLSIVLILLMTVQTAHAIWAGARVFSLEQPFGRSVGPWSPDFWVWWSYEYNVSLVADTFGVLLIVLLTKWLNERDSKEG